MTTAEHSEVCGNTDTLVMLPTQAYTSCFSTGLAGVPVDTIILWI